MEYVHQDNKLLRSENTDLKQEVQKLENSYSEMIAQFRHMETIQSEILNLQKREMPDLTNIEKMTDRQIQKVDHEFKKKLVLIKEEKEKRRRQKKMCETLSQNSSGYLKNFMRPYNPSSVRSRGSNTHRSFKSSPSENRLGTMNSTKEHLTFEFHEAKCISTSVNPLGRVTSIEKMPDLNPEHFASKQAVTEDQIMQNKNLNSTFGIKMPKKTISKPKEISPSLKTVSETINKV